MSLCTLPTSVSLDAFGMSPVINVVLFITETHLILCRKSGQQVWSSRLPASGMKPHFLKWSADGEMLALVFDSGAMVVYGIANGRVNSKLSIDSGVSSVSWPATQTDWLLPEDNTQMGPAAIGKISGDLSVRVYGTLIIDDIHIGQSPVSFVTTASTGDYACICDERLTMLHTTGATAKNIHAFAEAVRLMDSVWESIAKVRESIDTIDKTNAAFLELLENDNSDRPALKKIQVSLSMLALTGFVCPSADAWIKEHHELGFIKWYKTVSQAWDLMKSTLLQNLTSQTERLILMFGEIAVPCEALQTLLKSAYNLMLTIELRQPIFERVATFIEYVFTEEISRPIAVTKLGKVEIHQIVKDLANEHFLGKIEPELATVLQNYASEARTSLNLKVNEIRNHVREQLQLAASVPIDGKVTQLVYYRGGYKLILDDDKLMEIQGDLVDVASLETRKNLLVSRTDDGPPVLLGLRDRDLVVGDVKIELDFEPGAVTARYDEEHVIVACVLSEDCQHYQFLEVEC